MKYVLALIAAMMLAMPAAAQQHEQPRPGGGGGGHPATHAPAMHAPATHAPAMHATHAATHAHTSHTYHHLVGHRMTHTSRRHPVHHRHPTSHVRHGIHHAVNAAAKRPFVRAPRAAVASLRRNVVAVHRFHAGAYRAPPGFVYRRWAFGERLPAVYFAPGFWITDFLAFD